MSDTLKVYGHYVSQPSRAVLWTLAMKKLPFEFVDVNFLAGDTVKDSFLQKFPMGTIPTMECGSHFRLQESNAMLVYLAEKHQWNDLLPKSLEGKAQVQQWLQWQHGNLRVATTHLFRPMALLYVKGKPVVPPHTEAEINEHREGMAVLSEAMDVMEYGTLKRQRFLADDQHPTLADIAAYCELDQLVTLKLFDFSKWPHVVKWMERMRGLPKHDEVREPLEKMVALIKAKRDADAPTKGK